MSETVSTRLEDLVPTEAVNPAGDWGPLAQGAEGVVSPTTVDEVADVVRWAGASGTRVVPIGTGRHVPVASAQGSYILLSTKRLSSIDIYEPADLTLTAGAGLGVAELLDATRPNQQWLPFDPPDFASRTLGGLVASGRTGPLWAGYGDLKNHVLGAHIVCGDGRRLRLGGRVVKNVAGFDLLRPVVGSLGGLVVITSVTLRLFPVPAVDRLLVLERDQIDDLVPAARAVATAAVLPVSVVLTNEGGTPRLLVRLHGAAATVEADQRTLEAAADVQFRALEGDDAIAMARTARDTVAALPHSVVMFGMPTDLAALLRRAGAVSGVTVSADAYRCSVRVGATEPLDELLDHNEASSPAVAALDAGVRGVFDPGGVFWSPR